MSELLDIIISAVDQASDVFKSVEDSAEEMGDAIQDTVTNSELDDLNSEIELLESEFQFATEEVQRLTEELEEAKAAGDEFAAESISDELEVAEDEASRIADALSEATEEAKRLSEALQEADNTGEGLEESVNGIESLMAFQEISGYVTQLADAMWQVTDKAGMVQDSWDRLGLAAEGAGINVDSMKDAVSTLSEETGRAGGSIRESFIAMTSAGITDMGTMQTVFKGASAQAFILGTDVDSLANKFSGMAMKSTLSERTLKGTGVTMEELGEAMGLQGATIDEVKDKWEELDVNQRAAALGMAASMNEGKDANDEYKNSWEGLQDQIDIAKGKLEVLVGKVFLPVLIPVMETAGRILDWLGDTISAVMDGPFGTLISVVGSAGGALVLLVAGVTAITAGMGFFTASLLPAITASWALIAPWLPFIAIGVAVVAVIYEVGKAFGWWDDVGGMIDAVWAGIQRLWDAFINHPDVQAFIQALTDAWNWLVPAIMGVIGAIAEFLGINESGSFDVVHDMIVNIGKAWEVITMPIRAVIWVVQQVISVFDQFRNGQIDLPAFIISVLTMVWNAYVNAFNTIINLVIKFGSQLLARGISAASKFVSGIVNRIAQTPNRVYLQLLVTVALIRTAIQAWITAATNKAGELVTGVYNKLLKVKTSVENALNGVKDAIVKPFQDAYNTAKGLADDINGLISWATGGGSAGYDYLNGQNPDGSWGNGAAGYQLPVQSNSVIVQTPVNESLDINHNITLDFDNVPAGIDMDTLLRSFDDQNFIRALVDNQVFQNLDAKVKTRIAKKNGRARGY